jgi:outer membrane protein assembly factor BamB
MMLQLEETADGIEARVVYEKTRREFACEQHTPIRYAGHLYTVMPKDGGARKEQLACMTVDGTFKWASGKDRRFGLGPYLLADHKLYVMSDRGTLVMARAVADGYRELDHARVLDGREAWAPLAIVDGRLLTRDATTLVCLDIAATP